MAKSYLLVHLYKLIEYINELRNCAVGYAWENFTTLFIMPWFI